MNLVLKHDCLKDSTVLDVYDDGGDAMPQVMWGFRSQVTRSQQVQTITRLSCDLSVAYVYSLVHPHLVASLSTTPWRSTRNAEMSSSEEEDNSYEVGKKMNYIRRPESQRRAEKVMSAKVDWKRGKQIKWVSTTLPFYVSRASLISLSPEISRPCKSLGQRLAVKQALTCAQWKGYDSDEDT